MADITITAGNVIPGANAVIDRTKFFTGVASSAGILVYLDDATQSWKATDANVSAVEAALHGMLLVTVSPGQPAVVQTAGDVTLGAVLSAGEVYVLSSTAGRMAPVADLITGMFSTVVGIALSSSVLRLAPVASGVARA